MSRLKHLGNTESLCMGSDVGLHICYHARVPLCAYQFFACVAANKEILLAQNEEEPCVGRLHYRR